MPRQLAIPTPSLLRVPGRPPILNPQRRNVMGTLLVPDSSVVPVVVAADGASAPIAIAGQEDAISEVFQLIATHNGVAADIQNRMTVRLTDTGSGSRYLSNRFVPANHVFGTALNPMLLESEVSEPLALLPTQILQFEFRNPSSVGSTSFEFALGTRIFTRPAWNAPDFKEGLDEMLQRKKKVSPYWLTTDAAVSLASGASADVLFTAPSGARLLLTQAMSTAIITGGAGDQYQKFAVDLWDGKERKLNNQAVAMQGVSGASAAFPLRLAAPLVLEPKETIHARFKNLSTGTCEVFFTWQGVALYA